MIKVKNLQACLELAGNNHSYQIGLVIALSFLFFFVNFILIGPSYIFMNPSFKCQSTGQQIINEEHACHMINECQIIQQFTLTAKMRLYCQSQTMRVVYQTLFSVGSLIGLLCMNTLADTHGRRYSTILSMVLVLTGIIFNIIGGTLQNTLLLIVSQILLGFGGYSLFVLSFILLGDFCQDSLRQTGIVMLNAAAGVSLVFMGVFYLIQLDWKLFLLLFLWIPLGILLIVFLNLLEQSPYILMVQGQKQNCLNTFKRICAYNKTSHNIKQIKMLLFRKESVPIRDERPYIFKIMEIVRKWQNLKVICLVGLIYAIGNVMYFGIEFTFEDQGYNYGINSMIIGSFQMFSFGYLHLNMERISRTRGISVFFGLTAIVGLLFMVPIVQETRILSSGLIGVSRIFFSIFFSIIQAIGYTLIVCLQTESFSLQIQSTAAGIIQAISLLGIIVAPSIVSYSMWMGWNSIVVLSLLLLLAIIPTKFINETHPDATSENNSLFVQPKQVEQLGEQLISIHSG